RPRHAVSTVGRVRQVRREMGRMTVPLETGVTPPPRVSVAIPVLNEAQSLPELLSRVTRVLDRIPGGPHEIVVVDDGSTDRTFDVLTAEMQRDPRVVAIGLSRNF